MALDLVIGIFDHTLFFVFFVVLLFAGIGWLTGSFSVGMFSGFLMFINFAIQQDNVLLTNLLYISMVGLLFVTAYRVYDFSTGGNTGGMAG